MPTFNWLFWTILIIVPLIVIAWWQYKSGRRVK